MSRRITLVAVLATGSAATARAEPPLVGPEIVVPSAPVGPLVVNVRQALGDDDGVVVFARRIDGNDERIVAVEVGIDGEAVGETALIAWGEALATMRVGKTASEILVVWEELAPARVLGTTATLDLVPEGSTFDLGPAVAFELGCGEETCLWCADAGFMAPVQCVRLDGGVQLDDPALSLPGTEEGHLWTVGWNQGAFVVVMSMSMIRVSVDGAVLDAAPVEITASTFGTTRVATGPTNAMIVIVENDASTFALDATIATVGDVVTPFWAWGDAWWSGADYRIVTHQGTAITSATLDASAHLVAAPATTDLAAGEVVLTEGAGDGLVAIVTPDGEPAHPRALAVDGGGVPSAEQHVVFAGPRSQTGAAIARAGDTHVVMWREDTDPPVTRTARIDADGTVLDPMAPIVGAGASLAVGVAVAGVGDRHIAIWKADGALVVGEIDDAGTANVLWSSPDTGFSAACGGPEGLLVIDDADRAFRFDASLTAIEPALVVHANTLACAWTGTRWSLAFWETDADGNFAYGVDALELDGLMPWQDPPHVCVSGPEVDCSAIAIAGDGADAIAVAVVATNDDDDIGTLDGRWVGADGALGDAVVWASGAISRVRLGWDGDQIVAAWEEAIVNDEPQISIQAFDASAQPIGDSLAQLRGRTIALAPDGSAIALQSVRQAIDDGVSSTVRVHRITHESIEPGTSSGGTTTAGESVGDVSSVGDPSDSGNAASSSGGASSGDDGGIDPLRGRGCGCGGDRGGTLGWLVLLLSAMPTVGSRRGRRKSSR